jgi:hypothetical protein
MSVSWDGVFTRIVRAVSIGPSESIFAVRATGSRAVCLMAGQRDAAANRSSAMIAGFNHQDGQAHLSPRTVPGSSHCSLQIWIREYDHLGIRLSGLHQERRVRVVP